MSSNINSFGATPSNNPILTTIPKEGKPDIISRIANGIFGVFYELKQYFKKPIGETAISFNATFCGSVKIKASKIIPQEGLKELKALGFMVINLGGKTEQ